MPNFAVSPFVVHDNPDQPKLWFPWFGPAEIGSIWPTSRKPRIVSATGSVDANHFWEGDNLLLTIETVLAEVDTITIDKVVSGMTKHRLEHQHDCEVRYAYLLIQRPDGTVIRPPVPLTFRGRNELLNADYPRNVLLEIEHRITKFLREKTLMSSLS